MRNSVQRRVGFATDQFELPQNYARAVNFTWTDTNSPTTRYYQTGVMHYRSRIGIKDIADGTTKTYLLGEKFLSPAGYTQLLPGGAGRFGDNQGVWAGFEWDNHRVAWNPASSLRREDFQPRQDMVGVDNPGYLAFGSAHPGGLNMAMCDGSVQNISYDIDATVHRFLANRVDGQAVALE